jgi:multidrug efflux pump subunit AcrA (membrane-fusion protein)
MPPLPSPRRAGAVAPPAALLVALALTLGQAGCNRPGAAAAAPKKGNARPVVTVVPATARDVPIRTSNIGTTAALEQVTIRARVAGFLTEKHFDEGQDVTKGQLLLVIDEAPFLAARDAAKAAREQAEAELDAARTSQVVAIATARLAVGKAQQFLAQVQYDRSAALFRRGAITREELDEKGAAKQQADADVQTKTADLEQAKVDFRSKTALATAQVDQAKAKLTSAELDLAYCRMTAPIDGRAGDLLVKVGNYVNPAQQAELVSIQQLDPMGVNLEVSSRYLPELTRLLKTDLQINLTVQGDRPYPYPATAYFLDNTVDPRTSTVLVKARVPNPSRELLPGDYVRTSTTIGTYAGVVVVPEQAVIETQAGAVCYTVGRDGKVALTPVEPLDVYQGLRVLHGGLEPGTPVIVEGIQLVRPGMAVQAEAKALDDFVRAPAEAVPNGRRPGASLFQNPNVRLNGTEPASAPTPEPAATPDAPPAPAPAPKPDAPAAKPGA